MKIYSATTSEVGDYPIKIGQTNSVPNRITNLQTACPFPLDDVQSFDAKISDVDVHFILSDHRLHGEWFSPHSQVLSVIDRLNDIQFQNCLAGIRSLAPAQLLNLFALLKCDSLGELCNLVCSTNNLQEIGSAIENAKEIVSSEKTVDRSKKQLKYMRIALVAKELGVPRTTLISAVDRGEIDGAETACGLVLIDPDSAIKWTEDSTRRPGRKPATSPG